MPDRPRLAFVVSHTHWDREWYLPFHTFRVMLARAVSGILDALDAGDGYRHFCLDGQSIVLEDFLAVRPEEEARIRRLAASGALALGPWYVLPDEFLIPPEATVRNLLVGRRTAERFGPVQQVGYVPDAFGHVAQMPQILRLAGIGSFIYTRGDADEIEALGLEWIWEAPDGTDVLAIHQCGGYCNASALGHEEMWHAHTGRDVDPDRAVEKVRDLFTRMAAESNGDVWLLNNGCDHFPVQKDFDAVLDALVHAFPDVEFRHASFSAFVDAVRASGHATRRFRGELRGGKRHHVLSGVWSARMPLKQRNDEAHTWLADVCEPLAAYARFRHGLSYPHGLLDHAWRLLLQNQPHDSICGCSIDEVHREMEPRFDGVLQTAQAVVRETLQSLVPSFGTRAETDRGTALGVFNPVPEERAVVVDRLVVLQPFDGLDPDALRVEDESGRRLPFEIVARHRVRRFWGIDWRTMLDVDEAQRRFDGYAEAFGHAFLEPPPDTELVDTFLRLRFLADLPAAGFGRFALVEDAGSPPPALPDADRARRVMGLARQEAQRFNHDYLGTEHILLGLVQEQSGVAASVLENLNVDLKKIRQEVEKLVAGGSAMVTMGQLPFTPRAKKVLELSLEEASNLGRTDIGTEHVLLGLIREDEGIAAQVLHSMEVELEDVRDEVLGLLGAEPSHPEAGESPHLSDADRVRVVDGVLSNGLVAARLHPDGTIDVEDLRSGRRFERLNALQDEEDVGDEYDHSPAAAPHRVDARGTAGTVRAVDAGGLKGALEARFALRLPRRIAADRRRRVAETVDCPVTVRLGLEIGSPVLDVDVSFENRAEDHRLVARFPTGLSTDTVVSDAHFLLARRPVDPPDDTDWCQPAPDTVPQQEFSLVGDGTHGLAVLVRGLPEVAALRHVEGHAEDDAQDGAEGDVAGGADGDAAVGTVDLRLTLLRCVGWLSRDDFPTRRNQNAGPTIATPDAQCPGRHRFRYAILPFAGDEIEADVKGWSRCWRTPCPVVQGVLDGGVAGGAGLVSVDTRRTAVSAVKRHEERETLVVRLTNLVGDPVAERLDFGVDLRAAWRVDLHEARIEPLELEDARALRVLLRPHEILTVEVEPS